MGIMKKCLYFNDLSKGHYPLIKYLKYNTF